MTVIDLKTSPPRSTDVVPIGYSPETIEMSPDGHWVVAVLMNGSNLAPTHPNHTAQGSLDILVRHGKNFEKSVFDRVTPHLRSVQVSVQSVYKKRLKKRSLS